MKLRRVAPNTIKVPEVRVTARMDEDTQRQFEASVATTGIDEPIKCFEVEGQLILSDGLHRLQQALRNNLQVIDVYVRPGKMEDVLCNNLMSGHLRGKHPVSEMVRSIETLWKEFHLDSEAIARKTGLTRDYIEDLMLISELTPLCREALDDGKIKVGHARELTRMRDPVAQEQYLGQSQIYRWSVKELHGYIDTYLETLANPPTSSQPSQTRQPIKVACAYCGAEALPGEIVNPNTCRECSAIMLASLAQARRDATEADRVLAAAPASEK